MPERMNSTALPVGQRAMLSETIAWTLAKVGPKSKDNAPNAKPAGFGTGVWHGVLAPFLMGLGPPGVRIFRDQH